MMEQAEPKQREGAAETETNKQRGDAGQTNESANGRTTEDMVREQGADSSNEPES